MKQSLIIINRDYSLNQTFGSGLVLIDNKPVLDFKTLELPWIENKRNKSCIPEGVYEAIIYKRPKGVEVILFLNIPGRSEIEIHSGNFVNPNKSDVKGCILTGDGHTDIDNDGYVDIINSKITLEKIIQLIKNTKIKVLIY